VTVEFRELKWAITAAQHRSLRQAAETLNIRQSTLSRGLRDLETQLGAILFERTNGGTRPTIEGQEFLEAAKRIVEETETIAMRLKTRSRGESGRLTIGVHASFCAGNLRATIIEFRRRYPEVELHLVDGSSDHLVSDLQHSAIDVAFVVQGTSQWDDGSLTVWSERLVVALPDGHVLRDREAVHWSDLSREALLLPQVRPTIQISTASSPTCRSTTFVARIACGAMLTIYSSGCVFSTRRAPRHRGRPRVRD
jgi:DNA-binding transcriptional LysR family regulator